MKVLVTGGAGYIGSVLTRKLINRGYSVRVLDRMFFGEESLEEIKDKIEIVKDDIRYVGLKAFKEIDVVMDLASISNDPAGELDQNKTFEINYLGRNRIANMAKLSGVKRYILASSCSVYGFQDELLTEESKVNPLTTYAKCNYLAEQSILPLADDNFTVTALRQATVYGLSHRMRFDLAINGMTGAYHKSGKLNILKDGTQWRPFVCVDDTCEAFISVMESEQDKVNQEIFNVGSNSLNVQIFDLAERITCALDKSFNYDWYGDPDKRSYKVSFDKINKVLGYETKVSIEKSAVQIWNALEEEKISWNDIKTRTVTWYKTLLEYDEIIKKISYNGKIL